jgi:hypothetical protein
VYSALFFILFLFFYFFFTHQVIFGEGGLLDGAEFNEGVCSALFFLFIFHFFFTHQGIFGEGGLLDGAEFNEGSLSFRVHLCADGRVASDRVKV